MFSQCAVCTATTFTVNLTSKADTAWVLASTARSGTCCTGSNCIKFIVYLNPGSDLLSFNVTNPAPSGSAFYQINCGSSVSIGQPACISGGQSSVCITYCKPGGDAPNYHITASKTVKTVNDFTLRVGCAGTMTVGGLSVPTITWTSISPGTAGQYNSYLSCTTSCNSTTVIPTATTPTVIGYRVSGSAISGCPGINADTVMVTIVPGMSVNISPTNAVVCSGGASTVALTASISGGQSPYTYTWSTAQNSQSVGVPAGNYTVLVNDNTAGCSPLTNTITVAAVTTPTVPAITNNGPVCSGQTLSLSATSSGVLYNWTGPDSFTSSIQNPTLATTVLSSGVYSVVSSFSGCASPMATASITVNSIPSTPTISSNSPICATQNLQLNSAFVSGATYNWTGPNGFTSAIQNPTVTGASTLSAGVYSLSLSVSGCSSFGGTTSVTVNQTPAPPTISGTSTLCSGSSITFTTSPVGLSYSWTGPNGFTSSIQNPTITGATTLATGMYSVTGSLGSCTSTPATFSVNVFGIPPSPALSYNSPLCTGQTLSLSASLITGAGYNWTGPNGFNSSAQNPTLAGVTGAAAGNYSVAVNVSGCVSSATVIPVTINATPSAPTVSSNGPVCAGSNINLGAGAGGSAYNWTGPNSFSSGVQNPTVTAASTLATGMYSVTQSLNGCISPIATIGVTVNPIPITPTITGNTTLCAGQALSLTANPSGAIYAWTGPNSFTSSLQNPIINSVSVSSSGNYSVTRTVLGCTSPSGTISVLVNPIPSSPTLTSNSPICALQSLSLSASPGAASYNWTGPNSFISALQNPVITSTGTNAAGNYSATQIIAGCTSPVAVIAVTINQIPATPVVTGPSSICAGSSIAFTTSPGGLTYSWTGPNSFTSTSQNPVITSASTLATGMYSVTGSASGCTSLPGTFSVNVFGNPSPPALSYNSVLCTGQTMSLTAAFIAGAAYSWSGPNGFTSSVQNPTIASVTGASAGNYSLFVNVSGCGSTATVIAVSVNTTPSAPSASSNGSICEGSNINLGASNGGTSYNWSGPNTFISSVQNPTITSASTLATGMYSVTQTINGCISPAATVSVTVNPVPVTPTITGNTSLCVGQSLSLTVNPTGATYSWNGPNSFISTLQNPVISSISLAASGTYSVLRTVLGCTSPAGTISVLVNPIPASPTITSNSPICALQSLSLSASAGATSYNWTGPNSFTSALQNPVISSTGTNAAGNYSATQTNGGCVSPAAIINVTINPAAPSPTVLNIPPKCLGMNITFTQTPITGARSNL